MIVKIDWNWCKVISNWLANVPRVARQGHPGHPGQHARHRNTNDDARRWSRSIEHRWKRCCRDGGDLPRNKDGSKNSLVVFPAIRTLMFCLPILSCLMDNQWIKVIKWTRHPMSNSVRNFKHPKMCQFLVKSNCSVEHAKLPVFSLEGKSINIQLLA